MKNKKIIIALLLLLSALSIAGAKLYVDKEEKLQEERREQAAREEKETKEICQKEELDCLFVGCNNFN